MSNIVVIETLSRIVPVIAYALDNGGMPREKFAEVLEEVAKSCESPVSSDILAAIAQSLRDPEPPVLKLIRGGKDDPV